MREHAIPQDVTGYRFHIIGNMTLKQFAEVGAGCLIAVLLYTTNLPFIIKWPFICIVVGLGAMAAFVPFEERPFDHWIVTFFKVLYKPTKFFWRRQSKIPDPFLYQQHEQTLQLTSEVDLRPARKQRIREYLTSVQPQTSYNQFDLTELNRLGQIMEAFKTVRAEAISVRKTVEKPDLKVRVRAFRPHSGNLDFATDRYADDYPAEIITSEPADTIPLSNQTQLGVHQVAQDIEIPEVQRVEVDNSLVAAEDAAYQQNAADDSNRAYVDTQNEPQALETNEAVTTNTDLPFPLPPTEPNKLVGMILSQENNLINDAIVEIADQTGRVARAVKSNALGQFFIATPLESGEYTISVEHDGYQFNPLSIELVGNVVPPIEVRSLN